MNERRFLQLINLQIDGEISESEQEELEREIASDSRRRAVYQSYIRLQEASQVVCSQFGEALSETVDLKKYQILTRESHGWQRGFFYSVGALTAACAAVAAAVGFFEDLEWGGAAGRTVSLPETVAVEIFEPSRSAWASSTRISPEAAGIRFAPDSFRFLQHIPSAPARFEPQNPQTVWGAPAFRTGSSPAVIRSGAAFENAEPASFEFKR